MSKVCSTATGRETTRRSVVARLALVGVTAMAAAGLAARRAAAAPAKLSPNEIGYQPSPKGAARCDLCANWQPPGACKLVAGPISPTGWCGLFVRKA